MARILTLQPAVRNIQGRVNRRDRAYFKKMYDETFMVRVDNPYKGPRTEDQKQISAKFTQITADALALPTADPEKYAELKRKFATQRTYKTLRGYVFAKLWFDSLQGGEGQQQNP